MKNIEPTTNPTRVVYTADAVEWLSTQSSLTDCSIVTSLPDKSEFQKLTIEDWKAWFTNAAQLVLKKTSNDGIGVFFQTDIKVDGIWIDKSFLIQKAAESTGHELLAHKIFCRAPAGTTTFGRPAYSHLLVFSKTIRPEIEKSFADVFSELGEVTWTRGMGTKACELACKMILSLTKTRTVLDPFCGHGTVLAVANTMGLNAIGVDHSSKCVRKAEKLKWDSKLDRLID